MNVSFPHINVSFLCAAETTCQATSGLDRDADLVSVQEQPQDARRHEALALHGPLVELELL